MTKYPDVNKCRQKEKCKMAALITEPISQKKKEPHGGKEEEKREKQHFLKRNRRQEMSASNETKAEYV